MEFMHISKIKISDLPVLILAGGKGSRISEETHLIPKPMIKIGNKPILSHIIDIYSNYGFSNFFVLGGYKIDIIKNYFSTQKTKSKIQIINTGLNTMTGGRIYSLKDKIKNYDLILLTYGDGVANINIKKLLDFHIRSKKILTMTVVRPPARWGFAKIKNNLVKKFEEKNQLNEGWINGGFFVLNKKVFKIFSKYKDKKNIIFEKHILPLLAKKNQLAANKHENFWQCMDTLRDKNFLNKIWAKKKQW